MSPASNATPLLHHRLHALASSGVTTAIKTSPARKALA